MTWSPEEAVELADALAVRALSRCASTLAVAAACLTVLSLLFLQVSDGAADARTLPQLVVLGWGSLVALVTTWACATRARAVQAVPGTGPGHASGASLFVGRAVVAVPAGALPLAVASVVLLTPHDTALLSALVSVAVASQVSLLMVVRRGALRRAATRQATP